MIPALTCAQPYWPPLITTRNACIAPPLHRSHDLDIVVFVQNSSIDNQWVCRQEAIAAVRDALCDRGWRVVNGVLRFYARLELPPGGAGERLRKVRPRSGAGRRPWWRPSGGPVVAGGPVPLTVC